MPTAHGHVYAVSKANIEDKLIRVSEIQAKLIFNLVSQNRYRMAS